MNPRNDKKDRTYTILFIPAARERMKKLDVSHRWMMGAWISGSSFLALFFVFTGVALYLLHKENRMVELAHSSQHQKEEIVQIYGRLQEIHSRLLQLAHQEKKIRMILNSSAGTDSDALRGLGGPDALMAPSVLIQKGPNGMSELMEEMDHQLDSLRHGISDQEVSLVSLRNSIVRQRIRWAYTPSIWPVKGVLTSGFGWRSSPFGVGRDFHPGIDIAGPVGVPVVATAQGTVTFAGWDQGYGKSVRINNGNGFETLFGHLDQFVVYSGEKVNRGEVIGYLGNTGLSTGPHLHYEIFRDNVPINPTRYIIDY